MAEQLCNPSHLKHELELKKYLKPYTCDGCKEIGFGPRYRCEKCDFDLHKACSFPKNSPISHEFFPRSTFKFFKIPPRACHDKCRRICDACTKPINGFMYHCKKRDLDLHPCCENLKINYQIEDVEFNLHKEVQEEWYKNGGDWINVDNADQDPNLALQKVNLKAIQARGRGDGGKGNKFWRILKVFIKTIVSIVLGDPTTFWRLSSSS
ncbi:uncharacterized protein LOC120079114 [Benincasa hispida]|uniref:uncharacterized protein LOC120079114 n=1 Tax=Benincasa hispida TaxID=102211 RepID=UPI0018FF9F48|nr:uncharacterized protein LOC120079114 [Benincasa hispida]